MSSLPSGAPAGVPPGLLEAILRILRSAGVPVRRRAILRELETHGHMVSLAGLNRALDHTNREGLTKDTPEGVLLLPPRSLERAGGSPPVSSNR